LIYAISSNVLSYNVMNFNDLTSSSETNPIKKEGKNNKIEIFPSFDKSRSAMIRSEPERSKDRRSQTKTGVANTDVVNGQGWLTT